MIRYFIDYLELFHRQIKEGHINSDEIHIRFLGMQFLYIILTIV